MLVEYVELAYNDSLQSKSLYFFAMKHHDVQIQCLNVSLNKVNKLLKQ
jgi:hypothetical protein